MRLVDRWRFRLLALIVFVLLGAAEPAASASEKVVIRLRSGRSFAAELDARSNQTQLWLRFGKESLSILRAVTWESIVGVSLEDREISREELRQIVQTLPSSETSSKVRTQALTAPANGPAKPAGDRSARATPRIHAVHFEAELANWDSDVAMDGLFLTLIPADISGRAVSATGVLQVELVAAKRRASHTIPRGRGQVTERVGAWTQIVRPADFEHGRARLRFPFGAAHPEFDTSWATHGLVHVKFSVAGHGVFESSQDAIRIRPYAPLRDARELRDQPRFLASER
jgi:hypothetical protein